MPGIVVVGGRLRRRSEVWIDHCRPNLVHVVRYGRVEFSVVVDACVLHCLKIEAGHEATEVWLDLLRRAGHYLGYSAVVQSVLDLAAFLAAFNDVGRVVVYATAVSKAYDNFHAAGYRRRRVE